MNDSERPRIAVSACLLGEAVRYDGTDKRSAAVCENLGDDFDLVGICPEVGIGLGVPRPPIELVLEPNGVRVLGVEDRSLDVTESLRRYARQVPGLPGEIAGYVFKARSPSCALCDASLHDHAGQVRGYRAGMYADEVVRLHPELPVADEKELEDDEARAAFETRVRDYHQRLSR
ncbi:MAG: DUF523 domain-containing protein [Gammaproteobacteria bacterium]|jgi:uncharacterized protein YbbK (DUF523 family)